MKHDIKKIYGLIGYPLGHSFSHDFFNKKFEAEGLDYSYVNFELPNIDEFPALVKSIPEISGLNVTIPYKEKVMKYIDCFDAEAERIGAINVIKFLRNNKGQITALKGYNSDIIGFCNSISPLLKPYHKRALILGTGGASKAVFHGLIKLGIEPLYISRSEGPGRLTYEQITPEIMRDHTVIVNTTPLGMYPQVDACPPIPYSLVSPDHLCYDLIYNPETTLFMNKCAQRGAITKNGLEMLIMQALAAWEIWNS